MTRIASAWPAGRPWRALAASALACAYLALAAAGAPAAAPPSVFTGDASQLTISSATLNGSVYPAKQPTSYYFQYGLSSAYGAQTSSTSAGEGSQSVHVAVPITGLSPGTTYHYRLVAVNPSGTVNGLDRTFTTKRIPLTFTLSTMPDPDVFGSPFSVVGTLSGTASADHSIQLQANPFPFLGGLKPLGNTELTSASGAFSFFVPSLAVSTQLRVVALETPPANSPNSRVVVERVAVRVELHLQRTRRHGYVRFLGTVAPAEVGAPVSIQLIRRGHQPVTVERTVVRRGSSSMSRFSVVTHVRHAGLYRALVRVLSGAQVANHSRALLIK